MFADTRARDGAAGVVREDAGTDDGGIAAAGRCYIRSLPGSTVAAPANPRGAVATTISVLPKCWSWTISNKRITRSIAGIFSLIEVWLLANSSKALGVSMHYPGSGR